MSTNEIYSYDWIYKNLYCQNSFYALVNRIRENLAEEEKLLGEIKNLRFRSRNTLESIQEVLATDFDKLIAELGVDETGVPVESSDDSAVSRESN